MFNLQPMKFEGFKIDETTVTEVKEIIKIRQLRGGKSKFFRDAVLEKVEREKKKLQALSKIMNG